ncbi:hypothetical protein AB8880_05595 [Alphaproteobacteria bacterium LSUCC0684]
MRYFFPASFKFKVFGVSLAIVLTCLAIKTARADTLELICHDQHGRTRLLTAHTDAMLIYNPSRPQDVFWLDTSKHNYLDLLAFENQAWTFIYDRDRRIDTLYQRVVGDFYICEDRRPA